MGFKIYRQTAAVLCIALFTGCSTDTDDNDVEPQLPTIEVDVRLSLGTDWDIDDEEDTRAVPPGTGGNNDNDRDLDHDGSADTQGVNKVRIIAFRRKEGTSESFLYDSRNDRVCKVLKMSAPGNDGKPEDHEHFTAPGKLTKTYGFEYRVVAIAYNSTRESQFKEYEDAPEAKYMQLGEDKWFNIELHDGLKYEELSAKLAVHDIGDTWKDMSEKNDSLSTKIVNVPQLFFGVCSSSGNKSEIIRYTEIDENGDVNAEISLQGILRHGMAKLEVIITPTLLSQHFVSKDVDTSMQWVALLTQTTNQTVRLKSYDDFLMPYDEIPKYTEKSLGKVKTYNSYTPVAYAKVTDVYNKDNPVILKTWLLPCATNVALRAYYYGDGGSIYRGGNIFTAKLKYTDTESGGNGTGIISPDVHGNIFFFRRNHRYKLTIGDSGALFKNNKL